MRVKYKNALNHETKGSLEFYLLMHKAMCTFLSTKVSLTSLT